MAKTRGPYTPEFRRQLVELVHAGRSPDALAREFEPTAQSITGRNHRRAGAGDRVEVRGFGAFSVRNRPARLGRNPRTGAHVDVERRSAAFFKTGKEMRERLNRG